MLYLISLLSEPPLEAMGTEGRDWLLRGVRERETLGLFSFFSGSSCHMPLDWPEQRGLKSKGHIASPTKEGTTLGPWVINV